MGLVVWAVWVVAFRGLIVDDAFIFFRFAHRIHEGHGWAWNVDGAQIEGVTSLLWTYLLAPFASNRDSIDLIAKFLATVFALATVGFACAAARRVTRASMGSASVILLASPLLAFHAMSGMETALAACSVAAMSFFAVQMVTASGQTRAAMGLGFSWWLATFSRPELSLFGMGVATMSMAWSERGLRRGSFAGLLATFAIPAALTWTIRLEHFRHAFPLPFYVKHAGYAPTEMGFGYVALSILCLYGGSLAILGWRLRGGVPHRSSRVIRMLTMSVLLSTSCYLFFWPSMGFVYRFTTPFWVALTIAVAIALDGVPRTTYRRLLVALVVYHAHAALPAWHHAHVVSDATRHVHVALGRALAHVAPKGRLLALYDVGAVAHYSNWDTWEGAGLVTPAVSFGGLRAQGLIRDYRADVVFVASCRPHFTQDLEQHGYRLMRQAPWHVYEDLGRAEFQCIWVRDGYEHTDRLRSRLADIGYPPRNAPKYMSLYLAMKRFFRL